MKKPMFDTLEYFITLRKSGMPEEKAQAIVKVMKKMLKPFSAPK